MSETDTDIDEPPTKVSKIQEEKSIKEEHLEGEEEDEMGEGQEEWLSEGILTDDDYNPGTEQETLAPSVTSACENSQMSQDDDETPSLEDSVEQQTHMEDKSWTAQVDTGIVGKASSDSTPGKADEVDADNVLDNALNPAGLEQITSSTKNDVQNIEEALNSFDAKTDLTDVLDTFLIRKPESKIEEREMKNETPAVDQRNDDGNDTDELLRLLGDDDNKMKKKVLVKKSNKKDIKMEDSSDDDFTYEVAASVKTIRVAREVLMKGRPASKAVPEDLSDGGNYAASSDEASTVKKMFGVTAKKSTATSVVRNTVNQTKPLVKHVVHINKSSNASMKATPARETGSKVDNAKKQSLKPAIKVESLKPEVKSETVKPTVKFEASKPVVKLETMKTEGKSEKPLMKLDDLNNGETQENEEIIDEEEFLEEDEDFELDEEEFAEESEMEEGSRKQRIMRPERMDEEVPSDAESHTEDGSLYDEIPSSDSEDLDDWFTLDIRSERAGDYIPLLGPKARELLVEEKKRVSSRLATLRQSLSALTESGRKQAEQLRQATMSLAELDDMLKAT